MNINRWIKRREKNWQHLDSLLRQVEKKGLKSLPAAQIREMASLYRSVSADLARAKTHQVGNILEQDLQRLTTRGYTQIYQGNQKQEWQAVWEFFHWGFPAVVQETWVYTAVATVFFLVGGLVAWWYSWQDPVFMSLIVPESLISQVRDRQELWMGSIVGVEPMASTNIMINNLRVSFSAVAGGISGGIYTVYLLVFNGLLIGAIGALVGQHNLAVPFWAFVFPHGALELPAIFLAGGAGLLIARAILFSGKYGRVDALKFYGFQAAQLVFGVVVLLVIAGIIEGFFSPSPLVPDIFKYIVGMGLFLFLCIYCSQKKGTGSRE
ncbi:MAG: stage II sporulation protein M [Okeania sp. SIO2G4]|uniref:stage II sporulation protein M n=1 Tax=unclassified Okeania TaxID=2634635 RepID=UPI0013BAA2CB|nr:MULTISPECIES: stage II sporulation protein M [unclassified Okeania]NEP04179.1 stage II sporulation protein M [Okeania sp. SIO4D6]NEP41501.1 stage II sporulation protein M [Okeania sp. SIO2H7]NEP71666.1 stage II sporulation protein M [Okeania sp. SIO2G5]NEP91761.1 stage II sporulation protein M [Okeania sp. SIO2F5]NEQ89588.1 stage II sporulation protein M [Okeania sp. SIO2G4]